jgi:hypothetical protein
MAKPTLHRRAWRLGLAFFVLLGVAFGAWELIKVWPRGGVLEIRLWPDGGGVLCAAMGRDETFVVAFTHSVNRRPVYDTLRAAGDHLVIVSSRFDAFGAGMPESTTGEGTLEVAGDGWLQWTVNRPVPEVTLRVGRVAGHRLRLKGREIPLTDLAEPGAPLTLRVRRARFSDLLKGRCIP